MGVQISNKGVSESYILHQIGVKARLEYEEEETLLFLLQDDRGVEIPAEAENPDFLFEVYAAIAISNKGNITLNVNPNVIASVEYVDRTFVKLTRKINGKDLSQDVVLTGEDIPVSGSDDTSLSAALSNKADKSPPVWIDMPMTGDYTLPEVDKLQFGLNGAGETCICGLFETPSTTEMSEQFATLPEGFRPKGKQMWIIAISSSTRAIFPVRIYMDGAIFVWLAKFPPSDTIVIPMQSFGAGQ